MTKEEHEAFQAVLERNNLELNMILQTLRTAHVTAKNLIFANELQLRINEYEFKREGNDSTKSDKKEVKNNELA